MSTKSNEAQEVLLTPDEIAAQAFEKAQEKVDSLLAEAEKKAQEIIASAEEKVSMIPASAEPVQNGPTKEEIEASKVKVPVELFKDTDRYKDDVYVAVNGVGIKIKRGCPVEIEQKFYEVLQNSKRQDARAADLQEALEADFNAKSDRLK